MLSLLNSGVIRVIVFVEEFVGFWREIAIGYLFFFDQ